MTRVARPDTDEALVDVGKAGTAAHVEGIVRAWRRIDRSVEAAEDELRDTASHLTTHVDENGMTVVRGLLTPEAGEVLRKALDAAGEKLYAEPVPGRPCAGRRRRQQQDRPSAGKVRADALALVAESALVGGLDPGNSGDRYQVVVHVNEAELATAAHETTNPESAEHGGHVRSAQGDRGQMVTETEVERHVAHEVAGFSTSAISSASPRATPIDEALQGRRRDVAADNNFRERVSAETPARPDAPEATAPVQEGRRAQAPRPPEPGRRDAGC